MGTTSSTASTGVPVWVVDTSSICEVRRAVENTKKSHVFSGMAALVESQRLFYPKQVVDELKRTADPNAPDPQYQWADKHQAKACQHTISFDEVKNVLGVVPRVLDPDKDMGVEEADPYVLALAVQLRSEGKDCRIITEEKTDIPKKMSLRTAAGLLGTPSVPLLAFLEFEKIYVKA